ncbi:DUF63 family protein [Natronococcus occultus]|uniref:Putative membrane protein n=1 Tax=Natronococcus occultus SP4 TaxID=694430 RepID=L0JU37_9EURY|nr:DUF63 family protein [Natronococcus occultus]AGB36266.1 putative membrane protein [Natronococcus occultus SP4]
MVLPEGFALPPWQLLVPLVLAAVGVGAALWSLDPRVTDRTVLAFAPWMVVGSSLHVLHRLGAYPEDVAVLFGTPSVYLVTGVVAGAVWIGGIVLERTGVGITTEWPVAVLGGVGLVGAAATAVGAGGGFDGVFWPLLSVVLTVLVTAAVWIAFGRRYEDVVAVTGATGLLVVFGHTLDGISTAIGFDVLGASEEVPLSLLILEAGHALPTAEYVGGGWLFIVVKIALALVIVGLFREYVEDAPRQGRALLALLAAVGLGPGAHNVLLFLVT